MFQHAQTNSMMGLDINCFAITLLELSNQSGRLCIENYAREPIPSAFEGISIKNVNVLVNNIRKLVLTHSFCSNQVIIAIPDSLVISKIVQVGKNLTARSLEEFMLLKAECYFPSAEKISFDFEIIGPSASNPSLLDVLLVAAKTENLRTNLQIIEEAELIPKIVDVESYAMERAALLCIESLDKPELLIGFINLGINGCQLLVFQGKKLIFSKEEPYGELQFLEKLATYYRISLEKARQLVGSGFIPEEYKTQIIDPFKKALLVHIKRLLDFFYLSHANAAIYHVFVAGNLVRLLCLDVFINQQLGLDSSYANPLALMSLNKNLNKESLDLEAPALMLACGLALRNLK